MSKYLSPEERIYPSTYADLVASPPRGIRYALENFAGRRVSALQGDWWERKRVFVMVANSPNGPLREPEDEALEATVSQNHYVSHFDPHVARYVGEGWVIGVVIDSPAAESTSKKIPDYHLPGSREGTCDFNAIGRLRNCWNAKGHVFAVADGPSWHEEDMLRQPTTDEETLRMVGPNHPVSHPGTYIDAGGLLGVVMAPLRID